MDKYNNKITQKTNEIKRIKKENQKLEESIEASLNETETLQKEKIRLKDNLNRVKEDRNILLNQDNIFNKELNKRLLEGLLVLIVVVIISLLYGLLPIVNNQIIIRQIAVLTIIDAFYQYSVYKLKVKKFKTLIGNVNIQELNAEIREYQTKITSNNEIIESIRVTISDTQEEIKHNLIEIEKLKGQVYTLNVRKSRLFGFDFDNTIGVNMTQRKEINI